VTPDEEATFTAFVAEHGSGLLRYARLLFGDLHEAEDGLQTALIRVVGRWDKATAAPVAYTRTVLRNLAIDGGRRRHLVPLTTAQPPDASHVSDIADAQAAAASLDAMLAMLPPRQRVTVVLRVLDGLSEAETATAMSCSTGTVKSNLSRGLAGLREHLNRERAREGTAHEQH
jgi:RNA polymerase sigma-70 factor (sigma-E family)